MKAVIFSCSLKKAKNSDSHAWSELMAKTMREQSIATEIINLRKFDYEASLGHDLLHQEMAKCYDADLIIFAAPVNFRYPNFYVRNLAERFTHAFTKAKLKGINLFEGKYFEICMMFGCKNDNLSDGTEIYVEYGGKFHRQLKPLLPDLNFILPKRNLGVRCWNPTDRHGPTRFELGNDKEVCKDIQDTIDAFKNNYVKHTPTFSLDVWMECFNSDHTDAFGRGYTLSVDRLSKDNVENHIKWVHRHFNDAHLKAQIFVSMKERCIRAEFYEGAERYFEEQFELGEAGKTHAGDHYDTRWDDPDKTVMMRWKKDGFRITRAANYRPNNY